MRGHIVRRGKSSWRIKFDIDASVGKRQTRYVTVRGKRQDAERELAKLIASAGTSSYVEPSKVAVRDFVLAPLTNGKRRAKSQPGLRSAIGN